MASIIALFVTECGVVCLGFWILSSVTTEIDSVIFIIVFLAASRVPGYGGYSVNVKKQNEVCGFILRDRVADKHRQTRENPNAYNARSRSQELTPGLPRGWQGPSPSSHHLPYHRLGIQSQRLLSGPGC